MADEKFHVPNVDGKAKREKIEEINRKREMVKNRIMKERLEKRKAKINKAFLTFSITSFTLISAAFIALTSSLTRKNPYDGKVARFDNIDEKNIEQEAFNTTSLFDADVNKQLEEIEEYLSLSDTLHKAGFDGGTVIATGDEKLLSDDEIVELILKHRSEPDNVEVIRELNRQASLVNGNLYSSYEDLYRVVNYLIRQSLRNINESYDLDLSAEELEPQFLSKNDTSHYLSVDYGGQRIDIEASDLNSLIILRDKLAANINREVEESSKYRFNYDRNALINEGLNDCKEYENLELYLKEGIAVEATLKERKGR